VGSAMCGGSVNTTAIAGPTNECIAALSEGTTSSATVSCSGSSVGETEYSGSATCSSSTTSSTQASGCTGSATAAGSTSYQYACASYASGATLVLYSSDAACGSAPTQNAGYAFILPGQCSIFGGGYALITTNSTAATFALYLNQNCAGTPFSEVSAALGATGACFNGKGEYEGSVVVALYTGQSLTSTSGPGASKGGAASASATASAVAAAVVAAVATAVSAVAGA